MTDQEFAKFASAMKALYSRDMMKEDTLALELWYEFLRDLPYEAVMAALKRWVLTNKWAPSISEIRQMVVAITDGEAPDWGESWKTMKRMISKWGYMREDKALEEMDPITREVVQRLGFQSICQSEDENVLRGQFRRVHEDVARRRMEDAMLTDDLKKLAGSTAKQLEERHD